MAKFFTRSNPRKCAGVKCSTPALNPVQRQFKGMCDINNIVQRAFAGDSTVFRAARIADIKDAPDSLHDALQRQVDAQNAYNELPLAVRQAYPTPELYFAALHDEKQVERLKELGIVEVAPDSPPVKVEITNPVTSQEA